jgi:hypothetical protein
MNNSKTIDYFKNRDEVLKHYEDNWESKLPEKFLIL